MNNFEIHDAATELAAGRTAYSLAREVLGLRAQVDELRQEREENIGTLAAQDAILGIIANRLGVPAAPLRKPQGEKLIEALSRQGEERAQLRKTLACMEAKEGEELTDLYQQVNDLGAVLEYVGQALGEPLEPLHTFDERVSTAAKALEGLRAELRVQADDAEILRRCYHRCCEEISELKAALVEEGEPAPTGPAVALVHRLKEERTQLRDALANMEAEEGKEITALEQEIEAANDIASDLATRLDLVRQALGVPVEPHQSLDELLLEAAEGIKAERDALVAHMVQTNSAGHALYQELKQWSLTEGDPESVAAMREWERVWSARHTTALNRRDAEVRLEFAREAARRHGGLNSIIEVAESMNHWKDVERRQAEKAKEGVA